MFDFCFKRLFSSCRELCSSGKGQRWGRAGGRARLCPGVRVRALPGACPVWPWEQHQVGHRWSALGTRPSPLQPGPRVRSPTDDWVDRGRGQRPGSLFDRVPACGWGGSGQAAASCPIGLRISICASALSWEECARPSDLGEGQSWPVEGPAWWPRSGKGGGGSQGAQWEPSISWGGLWWGCAAGPPRRVSSLCPCVRDSQTSRPQLPTLPHRDPSWHKGRPRPPGLPGMPEGWPRCWLGAASVL